jgi:hypothetical protein
MRIRRIPHTGQESQTGQSGQGRPDRIAWDRKEMIGQSGHGSEIRTAATAGTDTAQDSQGWTAWTG